MSPHVHRSMLRVAITGVAVMAAASCSSKGGQSGTGGVGGSVGGVGGAGGSSGSGGHAGTGGMSGGGMGGAAGGGMGGMGTGGTGGLPGDDQLTWQKANLTNFESYPAPGSSECTDFNGCKWEGMFAFVDGKQTEAWVMQHDIIAVHEKFADQYALKTFRLRQGSHEMDATVYDECADSDCNGCCTQHSQETGFLIDIEKYTMQRFGSGDGIVEWACVDCE